MAALVRYGPDVGDRLQQDGDQRNTDLPPVRAQVSQQPAHEPAVVRFSEYFLFLGHGIRLSDVFQRLWDSRQR